MKPVFKCDYCGLIATKKIMKVHEPACIQNYKKKSCYTCQYRNLVNMDQYQCTCGEHIPENSVREFCKKYKRQETPESFAGIFTSLLGDR